MGEIVSVGVALTACPPGLSVSALPCSGHVDVTVQRADREQEPEEIRLLSDWLCEGQSADAQHAVPLIDVLDIKQGDGCADLA